VLSQWRVLEWPEGKEPDDPLAELKARRPTLGWPFPLQEACFDVQPLAGSRTCSLVAGVSRPAVEAWVDVFAIAGGTLHRLFPSQAVLMAAVNPLLERAEPGELLALVEPSTNECQVVVWRDGIPEYERTLPLSIAQMLPALRASLGFCRARLGGTGIRVILADHFEGSGVLSRELGVPVEMVERAEYGSIHLQGLAMLEQMQ
jgi:Tfp pilus assembly PilM family ATPase